MRRPGPELIDRLAAEYVLGTLRGRARDRFERWIAERDEVRSLVRAWEDRLVGLVGGGAAVAPSGRVWREIELRLGLRVHRTARERPARARWLALAAGIAALGVAVLVAQLARTPEDPWRSAAVLAAEGSTTAAWRIDLARDGERLRARAERPPVGAAGTDYELWALPEGGRPPVSLGLLPKDGASAVRLTPAQRAALGGAARLAVSLEPAGGSPTGAPTGPVLIVAPLSPAV